MRGRRLLVALGISAVLVACTTLDEPRGRAELVAGGSLDGGVADDAGSAEGGDAAIPCHRSHNWRIRGLPASFFAAPTAGVGVWGMGDAFKAPDSDDNVILDAYVAGTVGELRGRHVVLGQGVNASPTTLTHLFVLRLGCTADGSSCAPGLYVPVSGEAVATRLEAANGSSLEIEGANVVLRRAVLQGSTFVFTEGPDACEFFYRLVVGGQTFTPTQTCAQKDYPECPFLANAEQRHP